MFKNFHHLSCVNTEFKTEFYSRVTFKYILEISVCLQLLTKQKHKHRLDYVESLYEQWEVDQPGTPSTCPTQKIKILSKKVNFYKKFFSSKILIFVSSQVSLSDSVHFKLFQPTYVGHLNFFISLKNAIFHMEKPLHSPERTDILSEEKSSYTILKN